MKFIDAHAHLRHDAKGLDTIVESGVFERIWLMDLSGIGSLSGIPLATQQEVLSAVRRYKGFFIAFGFVDLDHAVPDDIDRLRDLGFVGLKPYKQLKPYSDPAYYPLYERAQTLDMAILFHTGRIVRSEPYNGGYTHAFGPENMRPVHLAAIAEAFPYLQIVGGHQGWPWMEEMEQNLYYYRNITGDVSGYMRSMPKLNEILDRRTGDGTERYFNEKLHFGTDVIYGSEDSNARALRLAKFWESYFEFVGQPFYRWGLPEGQEKFFRGNALKIESRFHGTTTTRSAI